MTQRMLPPGLPETLFAAMSKRVGDRSRQALQGWIKPPSALPPLSGRRDRLPAGERWCLLEQEKNQAGRLS